jgi:hypothetical protein
MCCSRLVDNLPDQGKSKSHPPLHRKQYLKQFLSSWDEKIPHGTVAKIYMECIKEWKFYHLFRDWYIDYDQYKEALNFSEVVKGTTLVEKKTNTIVDKLPLKIHISDNESERTKRQVELSYGCFDCSNRIVEWMKDDDNPNREACN